MGRPKSKEVEAVEEAIERMHAANKLNPNTKPRDVAAELSDALAKKMANRISPLLKKAKRHYNPMESEEGGAVGYLEIKRLAAEVKKLGGIAKVKALVAEVEKLDQRREELSRQLRPFGGVGGAKQALTAIADLTGSKP